jgi:dTDP-4-dehydrorhamnose reductase
MKCLILGDGLLGSELQRQTGWDLLSRKKDGLEFNDQTTYFAKLRDYDLVINCIANTDTYSDDKESMWETNYKSVTRLCEWCNDENIKLVHISTDYVYANNEGSATEEDVPMHANNWYSYTKLLADAYIELKGKDYLIIRCSHKPNPFPYEKAFADVSGNFDYVDVIAENIVKLINTNANGIYNVGTVNKTIYMLAQKTVSDVKPGLAPVNMPKNTNMNINKFNTKINGN